MGEGHGINGLAKDFNGMSEMFWNLTCSFEEIIEEFKHLEVIINTKLNKTVRD